MTIWLILALSGVALVGAISAKFLGKDNAVEEVVEQVIESHTGVEVDLSPDEKCPQKNAQALDLLKKEF